MLRLGLVGLGNIASVHARNIALSRRLTIKRVYDPYATHIELFAREHGCLIDTDLNDLVGADDIDAVIIASPTNTHRVIAQAAALAGKAIYCEKPLDLDLLGSKAAVDVIRAAGVPVMMGFNRRFDPSHAQVKEAVRSGALGQLQILQMTSRGPQKAPSPEYVKSSGGFFRDKGVHFFDLLRFITDDEPVEITAMGAVLTDSYIGDLGDYDTFVATLRMRSGALCQIDNTRRASYGYDERLEAFGANGMLELSRIPLSRNVRTFGNAILSSDFPQTIMERVGDSYRLALEAFADFVLDGKASIPTIDDGLAAQIIAEAAAISATERRVVTMEEVHRLVDQAV